MAESRIHLKYAKVHIGHMQGDVKHLEATLERVKTAFKLAFEAGDADAADLGAIKQKLAELEKLVAEKISKLENISL